MAQLSAIPGLILAAPEDTILSQKLANLRLLIFEKPAGNGTLEFISAPRMPLHEYVLERAVKQIGEIYSQHSVSRGETPGSRFPAKGLQMLWKVDIMSETPTGRRYLEAFRKLGELELGEGRRVWPEKVIADVLGENGRFQREAFQQGEFGKNIDVKILPDKEQGEDKDSIRKWLVEAAKAGLVPGDTVRRELGKPSKDDMTDPLILQENNCKEEERSIVEGAEVPTQWYDDHVFHFKFHLRAGAKRGAMAEEAEAGAREFHVIKHFLACPAPRQPELVALLSQDMLLQIEAMAEAPPPDEAGVPGGVPPEGGEEMPEFDESAGYEVL